MDKACVDKIVLEFLKNTVHSQGSIKIQNLTGHFSQLPADIRKRFNCTKAEVTKFLLKYPKVFVVNDEAVSILPNKNAFKLVDGSAKGENLTLVNGKDDDDISDDDNDDDENDNEATEEKTHLINCRGKVLRKFDVYGFIEYCSPTLKKTVYFDVFSFEDGQNETFNKVKLDEEVIFHAKPSIGHKADYRATKVWRCGYSMSLQGSEKCYSSSTSLASQDSYQSDTVNGAGEVMKITANYGFIKPVGNVQGNVFFFRTKFQLPNVREVKNLEDVIKKGDMLYFLAIQSRKKNADAPWEATKVSRTLIENEWSGLSKHSNKSGMVHAGSTSTIDSSFTSSGLDTDKIIDENHIYDQVGSIQKLASNEPIITFGKNEVTYVPPNVVYKNNKLVEELGWELDEETTVHFNAECVNSNWRATLVWVGEKPALATSQKSHKKKNTQMKESTVSDLCEISLYDDQSDDGIWHTSFHVDTNSWDEENSENWPALEPPLSTKNKPKEKINLLKAKKIPKKDLINTVADMNEEKHSNESGSDSGKEVIGLHNSKRSQKKERCFDICSYATIATAPSKYFQQSNSYSDIERYKKNNGWEESSFNTNSEKWPALNEPIVAAPISAVSKDSYKQELNRYQNLPQEQMSNKLDHSDFVHLTSDMQESYYSDDEELSSHEIAPNIACSKDMTTMSPHSLNSIPQKVRYDKFSDVTGMITNVHNYFAFIKYGVSGQNLIFSWEQAFCDGLLVSEHYTYLSEAYCKHDCVNFTYCRMTDENGKEWTTVLQVWKGKKPLKLSAECIKQNEIATQVSSSNTIKTIPIPKDSSTGMLHSMVKNSKEDDGVSMEETETHEENSKPALWHKGKETEAEMKSYILSSINEDLSANELRGASELSQSKKVDAGNFFNTVLGLGHPTKLESPCCKELIPHTLTDDTCASSRNEETQTEIMLREEGTQTFVTGTVLSVAVFPQ